MFCDGIFGWLQPAKFSICIGYAEAGVAWYAVLQVMPPEYGGSGKLVPVKEAGQSVLAKEARQAHLQQA